MLKKLLFFWASSYILAMIVYYILSMIMPYNLVFGAPYRMHLYHMQYPSRFIMIPCFFYGIMATILANQFSKQGIIIRILLTLFIVLATILLSSPFGGMLWHYYDMKAGFFPENWVNKMIRLGFDWGLKTGWYIILWSIPYNLIGVVICYFLTQKGSLFQDKKYLN